MWVCQSNNFLSIVQPSPADQRLHGDVLLVRARRQGDIEATFPDAKVERTPSRDYLFRAYIPRQEVADAMAAAVMAVTYGNFKNSVLSRPLHDAFARIWSVMAALQPTAPYSGSRGRRQGSLL